MGRKDIFAAVVIIVMCISFLFILPHGLSGITTKIISEDDITFENPYPVKSIDIIGNCYNVKLQIDYHFDCAICNSKNINEYFWFKKLDDSEFEMLKGDRKVIRSGRIYTAEKIVNVCSGNSYEWYVCIDDVTLKCAGKNKSFRFDVK